MNKIEVGKKYYMDFYGLFSWNIIVEHTFMYFDPEFYDYKVAKVNDIDNLYNGCFHLIEVTYLGKGVFYESLTKTRILVTEKPDNYEFEDYDEEYVKEAYVNLDDYINVSKEIYNKEVGINQFMDDNKKLHKTIALASMVYDAKHYEIYPYNLDNKEHYKLMYNTVRREILEGMTRKAELNKYKTVLELNFAYNKYSVPSADLIKQANEENEAFNLTLKSKENKDS